MASRNRERRQKRRRKKRIKPAVKMTIVALIAAVLVGGLAHYKIYQGMLRSQMMGEIDSQDLDVDEEEISVTKGAVSYTVYNVGKGEAILLKSGDKEALIDTGTEKSADKLCESLSKKIEGDLDYLVLTASGEGRLGGIPKIMEAFKVGTCIVGEMQGDAALVANLTKTANSYVEGEDLSYDLGNYATLFIIKPEVSSSDIRDKSLITYFTFGDSGFLALSDAGKEEISRALGSVGGVSVVVMARGGEEEPNLALSGSSYGYIAVSAPKDTILTEKLAEKVKSRHCYVTGTAGTLEFVSDGVNVSLSNEEEILQKAKAEAEKAAKKAAEEEKAEEGN